MVAGRYRVTSLAEAQTPETKCKRERGKGVGVKGNRTRYTGKRKAMHNADADYLPACCCCCCCVRGGRYLDSRNRVRKRLQVDAGGRMDGAGCCCGRDRWGMGTAEQMFRDSGRGAGLIGVKLPHRVSKIVILAPSDTCWLGSSEAHHNGDYWVLSTYLTL